MKTLVKLQGILVALLLVCSLQAQEYANFEITNSNAGTGTFTNAALPDFTWSVFGSLTEAVGIEDSETFDDGSQFEADYGQADSEENLRTRIIPNGAGTAGNTITSGAITTITFSEATPANLWGFCVTDIDVENLVIAATDAGDNPVSNSVINNWLVELFDADQGDLTNDIPKWDIEYAALLGSDTPDGYTFDTLVIGGMPSCEAPAAYFKPTIPIKTLVLTFMNLQEEYSTSYHLFIASLEATSIKENEEASFSIYPNPCEGALHLRYSIPVTRYSIFEVIDMNGKVAKSMQLHEEGNQTVDVSDLPAGMYFIKIQSEKAYEVQKLLIK